MDMENVLADLSAPVLAKAIEANQFEYWMDLGRSPQVTIHEDPELTWFLIGVPYRRAARFTNGRGDLPPAWFPGV